MAEKDYLDVNQTFWRSMWEQAQSYEDYLASSEAKHRERWEQALDHTHLTDEQEALLATFTRRTNLLVLSGVWCGDCVRQGPILNRLADAAPGLDLRLIDRDAHPGLTDMLRINGAKKVPVAVFLSEDFFEVQRFGDRTLSVYRQKADRETGGACAVGILPPEQDKLTVEIAEWVDLLERVHLILRTAPLLRERYGD